MRTATTLTILALIATAAQAAEPVAAADAVLEVYLPRTMPVQGETISLGDVCMLSCGQAALLAKASAVAMGRSPRQQETMVVDRRTILSRLAASGVDVKNVRFSGADQVEIRGAGKTISSEEILRVANAFVEANSPGGKDCIWRLVHEPAAMVSPGPEAVELSARFSEGSPAGQVKVLVVAKKSGVQVGSAEVAFGLRWKVKQAVAAEAIAEGALLTPKNVTVKTVESSRKPESDWQSPFGQVAAKAIASGTEISSAMLAQVKTAVAVKRDQPVMMKVAGASFTISAVVVALQDGRPGEFIKVRNIDSQRVVVAQVQADGSVQPASAAPATAVGQAVQPAGALAKTDEVKP